MASLIPTPLASGRVGWSALALSAPWELGPCRVAADPFAGSLAAELGPCGSAPGVVHTLLGFWGSTFQMHQVQLILAL